jgi:hypothetical protein
MPLTMNSNPLYREIIKVYINIKIFNANAIKKTKNVALWADSPLGSLFPNHRLKRGQEIDSRQRSSLAGLEEGEGASR